MPPELLGSNVPRSLTVQEHWDCTLAKAFTATAAVGEDQVIMSSIRYVLYSAGFALLPWRASRKKATCVSVECSDLIIHHCELRGLCLLDLKDAFLYFSILWHSTGGLVLTWHSTAHAFKSCFFPSPSFWNLIFKFHFSSVTGAAEAPVLLPANFTKH